MSEQTTSNESVMYEDNSNTDFSSKKNIGGIWTAIVICIIVVGIFIKIYMYDLKIIASKIGEALYLFGETKDKKSKLRMLLECIKQNKMIILLPVVMTVVMYYATQDPSALMDNTSSYVLFIGFVLLLCFGLFSSLPDFSKSSYIPFLVGGIALLGIAMLSYFSSYITPNVIMTVSNGLRIFILLMIVVGLAIGYNLFSENIKSLTGWKGFIANFIFYIPCLLSDGLEYLFQQYSITPNIVFILLIIELLLALGYIYIPKMIQKSIKKTAIVLQNKPVYLDKEHNVGNIENFIFEPLGDRSMIIQNRETYKRNYCINMWIFLNIQPSSDAAYANETNIFNYNNHPRITYKNKSENKRLLNKNVYSFYFSNIYDGNMVSDKNNNSKYEVNISNQKWNMITFNYFNSKVDLYINGNLERTFYYTNNIPDYSSSDAVFLGSDKGLNGAICNVTYNKTPLTAEQIATIYNINYLKNPPVDFIE